MFKNLTIEGGLARDNGTAGAPPGITIAEGGGVLVQGGGHVTFSQVSLTKNRAIGGSGRSGTSRTGNGAPRKAAEGGGLFLSSGTINLTGSKVFGNTAAGGSGGAGFSVNCPSEFASSCRGGGPVGAGGAGGAGAGSGLYVLSGSATILTSTISNNKAGGGLGGVAGALADLSGVSVDTAGNGGVAQGAGLFIEAGALNLRQTTVSSNSATGGIGGADGQGPGGESGGSALGAGSFVASGNVSLANTTFFANTANGGSGGRDSINTSHIGPGGNAAGGGLYLSNGSVSLKGVTLASNQALATTVEISNNPPGTSHGGGIANASAGLFINTTLIGNNSQDSGNASNGDDVYGSITSSYSLISQTAGASITNDGGNIFNVNPGLDPGGLKLNGGPTQTAALEERSPAIDTGDNAVCSALAPTGLGKIDQRGIARFRHGDNLCDIGAFEFLTLMVQPTSLSFGSEPIGRQTPSQRVSMTNNQTTSVTLSNSIGGADPLDFVIVSSTCGGSLASHASCTISIAFKPRAVGTRSAVLTVSNSPDPTSPYHFILTGVGR